MARPKKAKRALSVNVEIAITGGSVVTYNFDHEPLVSEALERANIDVDSSSRIRVNGESADLEDTLEDGDTLTLTSKIKGGI